MSRKRPASAAVLQPPQKRSRVSGALPTKALCQRVADGIVDVYKNFKGIRRFKEDEFVWNLWDTLQIVGGGPAWNLFVACLLHGIVDRATLLKVAAELTCPNNLETCSSKWWDAVDDCILVAIQVARAAPHARHSEKKIPTGDSLMGDVHANKVSVYAACQRLVDNKRNLSWAEVDAVLPSSLGKYTVHQKSWARRLLAMILAVFLHELKLPKMHKDKRRTSGPAAYRGGLEVCVAALRQPA